MKSKKSDKKILISIMLLIVAILALSNRPYSFYSSSMTPQSQTIEYGTSTINVTLDWIIGSGGDTRSASGAVFLWKTGTHPTDALKAYCINGFDPHLNLLTHVNVIATIGNPYYDFSVGQHTILFCVRDSQDVTNGKCEYNGVNYVTDYREFTCASSESARGIITVSQVTTTIPPPPIPDIWAIFNQLWNSILSFLKSIFGWL